MTDLGTLNFDPPRIYVLDAVWNNPDAARRAERLAKGCPNSEVRTFRYEDLPDIVVEEGWDHRPKMGGMETVPPPSLLLGLFRFDDAQVDETAAKMQDAYTGDGGFPFHLAAGGGAFVFFYSQTNKFNCKTLSDIHPNPEHVCRPQWRIHQGVGCPHQCAYCSLGGVVISHVNTEEYIERLADLLRQNPWQKTWLYDDVMDVLTLEPMLDTLAPLMRFFETTPDQYLILHTKSDRVQALIEAEAPSRTIVAWSLSGPKQSRLIEPETGTCESRIEAARACQDAGITIRYKFKPIVPLDGWRDEADTMLDLALGTTKPDNLSMTILMWMSVEDLKGCIPPDMLDQAYLAAAEAAVDDVKGTRNAPFPHHVREEIYRYYIDAVRKRDTEVPLTISTESTEMWHSLAPVLGCKPADYVCGCGAGATPNRKTLDTNPWHDVRAALTWDGKAPLPLV